MKTEKGEELKLADFAKVEFRNSRGMKLFTDK
jgi:hypothetical protein